MTHGNNSNEDASRVRETLQFIRACDLPAKHKKVLVEVLEQSLRDKSGLAAKVWQSDELTELQALLAGKVALNWQHADELLISSARQLNRSQNDVKIKATELGFGVAVDYWLARARVAADKSETT